MVFRSDDLTFMREVQESHMQDTGYRMVYGATRNAFGEPVETWTAEANALTCGIEMKAGNEQDKETMTTVNYDAVLRLPIDTTIEPKDHFKLTKQYGEAVTNIEYEIVSPLQRGPSGIRILLRKVEL
jgi:hypothetical protein